jgi:acetylornithine deacetylase/succinyl-diaminopimelate desuccinylase-like protein
VPDECRIFVDRRLTFGETKESIIESIEALIPSSQLHDFDVLQLTYNDASHTGAEFEYEKYFPAWALSEDHPLVVAGQELVRRLWHVNDVSGPGRWDFSTNGNYWCGKQDIPCIGFAPGNEIYAHSVEEHVPLNDVVEATKFYALLPRFLDDYR